MWFLKNELSQRIQRFLEVLWFVNQGKKQGKNPAHEFSTNLPSQKKERKKEKRADRFSDGVRALGGTTEAALWPGKKPWLSKTHIHTVSFSVSHKNTCT